jgi:CubicO group peptidase (beta-lactamase class C family)
MYRHAGYEFGVPKGADLAAGCDTWAAMPLVCEPGAMWNYSVSTDVLGRVVEIVSGQSLDAFFAERVLGPLGMADTGFGTPAGSLDRLAALYSPAPGTGTPIRNDLLGRGAHNPRPRFLAGGAGLVSTVGDYLRFARFLGNEGVLDGVRLLGPRTVRLMASNHLPGGATLTEFGRPIFAETKFDGMGFGLGVSVVVDPVATGTHASPGEFGWGGLASTAFWVAPAEDLCVVFMTQLAPSDTYPLRPQLKQLVYSAIVD